MPLKIEIQSVDGQFSKDISGKTCPQKVTGNYRVNWTEHQNKWPHLTKCSFAKPANNRLVDLLVDEKPELPDTKPMALSRLRSTERNLKKDDRVAEDY